MKNKSRFDANEGMCKRTAVCTSLIALALCSQAQVVYAQNAPSGGMHDTNGDWMGGWAGGGMWLWPVIGVLVVVLLAVVIVKLSKK